MMTPWHLVEPSPWPLVASLSAGLVTLGSVFLLYAKASLVLAIGLSAMALTASQWWRDIDREASLQGFHSMMVEWNMRWGMGLFIVSEVFFFLGFFWAYFHMGLAPTIEEGLCWPPSGSLVANPLGMPLLNTIILLSSGLAVTWSHHAMVNSDHTQAKMGCALTIVLGAYFLMIQFLEYADSSFTIADSVHGSIFYVATGFHGFHVTVGLLLLTASYARMASGRLSSQHHFGFEASAWYWHFVDVVWVFLFISVYYWGS